MDNFIEIYKDHIRVREATKQGYALAEGWDSINLEQPNSKTRRGRVGKGVANTLTCSCNQGVVIEVNTNKIIREIIPTKVKVRKYEVDIEKLKDVLKKHKKQSKLTNKQISEKLSQPLTLVEHWFRSDDCFSIPNEDIWLDLKSLLDIETDEFDKSIMTFEIKEGLYEKSNRVYDSKGIAPTLTVASAETERYIVEEEIKINELIQMGWLDGKHEQSNRVYSEDGIYPTIMAGERKSCSGGYVSPKVSMRERDNYMNNPNQVNQNNKGEDSMWDNYLEKFEFNMEELRIFDAFAGIGALHKSLSKLGVPIRVTNLSEVDIDAIISYSGVHIDDFKDMEFEYPIDEEMRSWLMDKNIGYDFAKGKSRIPRLNKDKLKLLYRGSYLLKNLGDISQIKAEDIEDFDLFNISFNCQDISNAGKQKGLRNEDGTLTRSGLIVPSLKLVRAKKPKYIMIENVKALIQKKFIDDFKDIISELEDIGYNCYYPTKEDKKKEKMPTCLNSKNFGIPQNRERIFVFGVRKDIDDRDFKFDYGYDRGVRLKHILEDYVGGKYYLSDEIQQRFKANNNVDKDNNELNVVGSSAPDFRSIGQRDITYGTNGIMSTLTATDYKQPKQIIDNKYYLDKPWHFSTDSDEKHDTNEIAQIDNISYKAIRSVGDAEKICRTLDTMGGGQREPKVLTEENKEFRIRKLTPLECWRLQGFDDSDFYKAKELGISDSQLYKQAGNSITVNVLYYQFKNLFKKYIQEINNK